VVDALSRSVKMIHLAVVSTCEMDVKERIRPMKRMKNGKYGRNRR